MRQAASSVEDTLETICVALRDIRARLMALEVEVRRHETCTAAFCKK